MAGKHRISNVRKLGVAIPVARKDDEEYTSKDIEIDWPEPYEPPYPLTEREEELLEQNQREKDATITWLKTETRQIVDEELGNGTEY